MRKVSCISARSSTAFALHVVISADKGQGVDHGLVSVVPSNRFFPIPNRVQQLIFPLLKVAFGSGGSIIWETV